VAIPTELYLLGQSGEPIPIPVARFYMAD